jgi:hypothetical protein
MGVRWMASWAAPRQPQLEDRPPAGRRRRAEDWTNPDLSDTPRGGIGRSRRRAGMAEELGDTARSNPAGSPESCCPQGHKLALYTTKAGGACDGCGAAVAQAQVMDCRECNWYLCAECTPQPLARARRRSRAREDTEVGGWQYPIVPSEGASKNRTQIPIIHSFYLFSALPSLGRQSDITLGRRRPPREDGQEAGRPTERGAAAGGSQAGARGHRQRPVGARSGVGLGAHDRPSPNFMGLASLALNICVFCDSL